MTRKARIDDAVIIADIIIEAWRYNFSEIVDSSYIKAMSSKKYVKIFKDSINENEEIILIHEENNHITGFVSASIDSQNNYSELNGLYIYPKYQGQGIGSILLQEIISIIKQKHCNKTLVCTFLGAKNNKFYMKHTGSIQAYKEYKLGNKTYQGICFEFTN